MTIKKENVNGNGTYEKINSSGSAYWLRKSKDEQLRLRGKFSGIKSFYGHKIESQAGTIDAGVIAGRFTIAELAINSKFKSGRIAESRVKQHLYAKLRDKLNCDIQLDSKGRVYDASNAASAENNRLLNQAEAEAAEAAAAGRVRHMNKIKRLRRIDKKIAAGRGK